MTPEFSRPIDAETISEGPRRIELAADKAERRRLAGRFRLQALDHLSATVSLCRRADGVHAEGTISARIVQSCVVTGEPLPAVIAAPFAVRYVPPATPGEEEIELNAEDLDTLPLGRSIDLGELAAETLALAIDPYPRSPDADAALREAGLGGEAEAGPFAALQALKDRLESKG